MRSLALLPMLVAAAVLAGCGGDGSDDDGAAGGDTTAISIEDALASNTDDMLLVGGNLLALGDDVRFCSALAESFPPQCGGASLRVVGLSLDDVDGLVSEGDVSWTDRPIELSGVVDGDTFTLSKNAP
jgi:hypothetical protein